VPFVRLSEEELETKLELSVPRIEMMDAATSSFEETIILISPRTGNVYICLIFSAKIRDQFDLHRFPFDRQLLQLRIVSFNRLVAWSAPESETPLRIKNNKHWRERDVLLEYGFSDWTVDGVESTLQNVS